MIDSKPTTSQLSFINKLREASPEREEAFQKLIREKGKSDANDLTMQEASKLIDDLKKIMVENVFVRVNGRGIMRLYCEEDESFDGSMYSMRGHCRQCRRWSRSRGTRET